MAEKMITETYTKETRRRLYDQAVRNVDDHINAGRSRLAYVGTPVRSEKSYTSSKTHENRDVKHLLENLIEAVKDLKREKISNENSKEISKDVAAECVNPEKLKEGNPELDELKKTIETLSDRISEISTLKAEKKEKQKKLKDEKRKEELAEILDAQKLIQQQLEDQKEMLINFDDARKTSDQILRDDVTEALTEHKQMTDNAVQELARKVSDLVFDNAMLRNQMDSLRKELENLYVDESEDETKKPSDSRSPSSCSSGSVAVILPPAAIRDGRRPSQAYHINTLSPTEELADLTAKKALEDATRISVSRM